MKRNPKWVSPKKDKPELLAPAGEFTSLQAAIQSGCDGIYFGAGELNMRQAAANFQLADIDEVHQRCADANVHAYLTLNTIVFPKEVSIVSRILDAARGRVDAVICWDPLVMEQCREREIPIHVSTQASVSNGAAAKMYKRMGAARVVPARECTLEELIAIKEESGLELEAFVHGAMCVSVSGRCFLSDEVCGKSGNRGECTQNCRREYIIKDAEDGHEFIVGNHYVLSAKDLCCLPFLDQLCDAGIDAFKIEGRGRSPEYVRIVVSAYREAVDAWADGNLTPELIDRLIGQVKTVYHRGFSSGFYMGRPIGEFSSVPGSQAGFRKEFVGRVTHYYPKAKVVEVEVLDNTFAAGTPLLILGETTGVVQVTPVQIRQNEQTVSETKRGMATFPLAQRARVGDKVYRRIEQSVPQTMKRQ